VYHFSPAGVRPCADYELETIAVCTERGLPASETSVIHAPLTIICTCTYWRNAWKYQAPKLIATLAGDNGTLLANMLAVATALGMPAKGDLRIPGTQM